MRTEEEEEWQGSNDWLVAMIDIKGWSDVTEWIHSDEIKDLQVQALWSKAEDLHNELDKLYHEITEIIGEP